MLSAGKAMKVSIYLSEGSTHHGVPTYSSILDFLFYRGVSGATVLKGIAGFGADHHMHSASIVEISDHLPLKIEFIESREKVNEILGKAGGTGRKRNDRGPGDHAGEARPGLEAEEGHSSRASEDGRQGKDDAHLYRRIGSLERQASLQSARRSHAGQRYCRRHCLPRHSRLWRTPADAQGQGPPPVPRLLDHALGRRYGGEAAILLPLVDQMVEEGLVVFSDVDIIKYSYRALDVDLPERRSGSASA
jgi:PII-like signaling protein